MKITALITMLVLATSGIAGATITMSLDRDMVDFRTMEIGQTTELADQGVYHNEMTLSSTNNRTWYLKVNMVRPLTSSLNTIPNWYFKWMVVDVVNGKGIVANNLNVPTSFTDMPAVVYTSDSVDNTGNEVKLRFRYTLTIPKNQIAGNYFGSVRWTMTELL